MEYEEENKIEETPEKKENISNKKVRLTEKMRENPWILSTLVLGILTLIFLTGNFSGGMAGNIISEKDAGDVILDFVESQTSGGGELVEVNSFDDGLYEVIILYQGQEVPLYLTKNGKNLVQGVMPLEILQQKDSQEEQEPVDVPKSDKPVAELFIMTHCLYGTQAEKGIIPAIKALGDSADVKIRFVHYFMHEPEETETPIQVCIREEQPDKFLDYLGCFLEDGDSDRCLIEAKIDKTKIDKCISSGKSEEYYAEDSALSEGYGVKGSPSLVINGQIINSGRDSASYLSTICSAFNNAPEECDTELSSASPKPMWGYGEGQDTGAQC